MGMKRAARLWRWPHAQVQCSHRHLQTSTAALFFTGLVGKGKSSTLVCWQQNAKHKVHVWRQATSLKQIHSNVCVCVQWSCSMVRGKTATAIGLTDLYACVHAYVEVFFVCFFFLYAFTYCVCLCKHGKWRRWCRARWCVCWMQNTEAKMSPWLDNEAVFSVAEQRGG